MTVTITDRHNTVREIELERHIAYFRQVVWLGGGTSAAYNTIRIEGFDAFQCTIAYDSEQDTWTLTEGQLRTECPKGLLSERAKACSMCKGCCVNPRTANPIYSLRLPSSPTLLDGKPLPPSGIILKGGETISV